jgi:hypothetical protein
LPSSCLSRITAPDPFHEEEVIDISRADLKAKGFLRRDQNSGLARRVPQIVWR